MAMFRWIETPAGGKRLVNYDQVRLVRSWEGITRLVFGAMPGGFDEIEVSGDVRAAEARLLAGEDWPVRPPALPQVAKRKRTTRGQLKAAGIAALRRSSTP